MLRLFLTSWLVSGDHFTVWHMDTDIQGAQKGEGHLLGNWLCFARVGWEKGGPQARRQSQTSSFPPHLLQPSAGEALWCSLGSEAMGYFSWKAAPLLLPKHEGDLEPVRETVLFRKGFLHSGLIPTLPEG